MVGPLDEDLTVVNASHRSIPPQQLLRSTYWLNGSLRLLFSEIKSFFLTFLELGLYLDELLINKIKVRKVCLFFR
jgi:hypothetical protein